MALDHLAVSAETLDGGVAHVETALGVALAPGGRHPDMGTHNRLLSLGPDLYLEVIAVDPAAAPPKRRRWFGLDGFAGPPRMTNWILRSDALDDDLAAAPPGSGDPLDLARGDLRWRMAVPCDGLLPFDGASPALLQWHCADHPARRLPDSGCRLKALVIEHPEAAELATAWPALMTLPDVLLRQGPTLRLTASIETPHGRRSLS
nr:VOC family protein [Tranquillimonas alkanivorans]